MFSILSLLVTAALMSHYGFQSYAAILDRQNINLDNNLQANVVPPRKKTFVQPYVRIKGMPETINLIRSEPIALECQVYASPNPYVSWLKNGDPIDQFEEESNEISAVQPFSIAHMTAKLVVSTPRDGDVYTCVAMSGVNQLSLSTTVSVQDPDLMPLDIVPPMKPVITSVYNEVIQTVGTNIVLPCRVHSDSKAQVYWEDNGDNVIYGNSRFRILSSGDLLITGLRWDDMGVFTCTAKNMYGKDSVGTFIYPAKAS
ncbi:neural/ectodermal development factor IMP-L2 isoform X2 [Hyposmocoma kahamanoa]|uniref:neural/ectodermal development factor IMP-L2 isoform X2 n=1 Tax=Hyposmocoma kahamanoa TaxID=1477025 RepID=UPI000E6D7E37|nr:neural/ectodermal development factor IMP-L2 isoform X2 [Hyposmocoma kahamanoa]